MSTFTKLISTAAVAALSVLGIATPQASAQVNPLFQVPFGVNPYYRIRPGLTVAQAYYNISAMGQAYANVPPYALGYNPYATGYGVPPVYNPGFVNPYAAGYNPYNPSMGSYANPYTPAAPGYGGASIANPYSPAGAAYDTSAAYNPYTPYADPYGGYLRGVADVYRAQSHVMLDQERARMLREQALQARLETKKKKLETELWIKANTPTYTEEQAKVAKSILKRIQTNASPAEIWAGTALNVLLSDLAKHIGVKPTSVGALPVEEEVLRHLNITKSGVGNLGLLRNEGRFTWPNALREMAKPADQKEMEEQAQALVSQGANGKVNENLLSELRTNVGKLRKELTNKVNDIPTTQYIESRRFLNNFEDALLALEQGDAVAYFTFQKFAAGAKTVQDITNYMIERGLRFAPAIAGDEAAYTAMHSLLAAYDVAVNTQQVVANKE